MPIIIHNSLPAKKVLEDENIFVMTESTAYIQDIRPLNILILNLMPTKITTETQLLRLLSNTPLQVEVTLLQTASHVSKNTPQHHLLDFYKTFGDIKHLKFDGMIITGAPIELMDFEDVDYWQELSDIMQWSVHNVYSTLHICWGAQAGLYYHYGIKKYELKKKLSGVYSNVLVDKTHPVVRGFDEVFNMPHSRYTGVKAEQIKKHSKLNILAQSEDAGVAMIGSQNGRQVFVFGHCEYDRDTLAQEYFRDVDKGICPDIPFNYFPNNDPNSEPPLTWRSHANLLFYNWLNYYVYQQTPFDPSKIR